MERLLNSITLISKDEIIVIDDCSRVSVYTSLKELRKKYNFTLLKTNENKGAGAARNLGLNFAKNEWLIFADSDDYFVEKYRDRLESFLETNFDIVYFFSTSIKESNNNSVLNDRHSYYNNLINMCIEDGTSKNINTLKYKMVVPWSKLVKREIIRENDIFFDEVFVSNDVMFSTKIGFYSDSIAFSRDIIYCCTENDKSLTSDISYSKLMDRLIIFKYQYNYLKSHISESFFDEINLTGFSYFISGFRFKYTLKEKYSIFKYLKKNNIKIISFRWVKDKVASFYKK